MKVTFTLIETGEVLTEGNVVALNANAMKSMVNAISGRAMVKLVAIMKKAREEPAAEPRPELGLKARLRAEDEQRRKDEEIIEQARIFAEEQAAQEILDAAKGLEPVPPLEGPHTPVAPVAEGGTSAPPAEPPALPTPLPLSMPKKVINAFQEAGLGFDDLKNMTRPQLAAMPGIGQALIDKIERTLGAMGIALPNEEE